MTTVPNEATRREELTKRALDVAKHYPVFVCADDKRPLTPNGFKNSTQNVEEIKRQFSHPEAALIGVPTGRKSGLFVLDVDPDGSRWLTDNYGRIGRTRLHPTRRACGWHLLFKAPATPVPCSVSKVARGVDIRSESGYVIWWPGTAAHLNVRNPGLLAEVPEWLLAAALGDAGATHTAANVGHAGAPLDPIALHSPPTEHTPEEVRAMLAPLDPDMPYGDWLKVLMAVHHQLGDAAGLTVADEWSARGQKYPGSDELRAKWASFGKYSGKPLTLRAVLKMVGPSAPKTYAERVDRTDMGNAVLLQQISAGDLRYVPELKRWLYWDGSRWLPDDFGGYAQAAALRVAEHYADEAARLRSEAESSQLKDGEADKLRKIAKGFSGWEQQCRSRARIGAMLDLASKLPGVALPAAKLDCDPYLLGVQNGVVDLRTGSLRVAGREEHITKCCSVAYRPTAQAPRWQQFIDEITGAPIPAIRGADGEVDPATVGKYTPRPALASYLKVRTGYSATGLVREHVMFIDCGPGANGKDVYAGAVKGVLGDYAATLPADALMASRFAADGERPSPFMAGLAGIRIAHAAESRDGQKLDVAVVKLHTGGGSLTARKLHENPREFQSTHKLMLATNVLPDVEHLDDALRGRLHIVPFDRQWNRPSHTQRNPALPDGDKTLSETLEAEAAGILKWVVDGAGEYLRDGLKAPEAVVASTSLYFHEQDWFARWLDTATRCAPSAGRGATELFTSFQLFVAAEGGDHKAHPNSQKAFSLALKRAGFEPVKTKSVRQYGLTANSCLVSVAGGG